MSTRDRLRIERRFCGPDGSGNGGYVAGRVGTALAALAAETTTDTAVPQVTLRRPPPLEVELDLLVGIDRARLVEPGTDTAAAVVAEAVPVGVDVLSDAVVDPVGPEEARAAEASYRGLGDHPFPRCFVCGPDNADGLHLRPGPVGDGRTACTWVPGPGLAAADGLVDPAFLWAVLDCPGGWTIDLEGRPSVLGRLTAGIDARPPTGECCVVMGRKLAEDGRKTSTATTLYDADGRMLARARQVWIAVDPATFN
jgi:hypothetical protein